MKYIYIAFLFLLIGISSFKKNSTQENTNLIMKDSTYHFYPNRYMITGILTVQNFYGPPNYGDSPKTDKIETCYLINLETPINILVVDTLEPEVNDRNMYNQTTFQIVGYNVYYKGREVDYYSHYLKKLVGYKISLSGYFFCAETGHHHTEVLFNVETVPPLYQQEELKNKIK